MYHIWYAFLFLDVEVLLKVHGIPFFVRVPFIDATYLFIHVPYMARVSFLDFHILFNGRRIPFFVHVPFIDGMYLFYTCSNMVHVLFLDLKVLLKTHGIPFFLRVNSFLLTLRTFLSL